MNMELHGKYGNAIVHTENIEHEAISQIVQLLNEPMAEGANVRIMPDVHAGAGCVIGYTAKLTDHVVPNLIGVDIGCGVSSWNIGPVILDPEGLDLFIKEDVPSGRDVNEGFDLVLINKMFKTLDIKDMDFDTWCSEMNRITLELQLDGSRVWNSLGTLGGGNHFIEIDKDDDNNLWLTAHTGSRGFGLKIANFHQAVAEVNTLTMPKADYAAKLAEIKRTKKGKAIGVAVKKLNATASVRKHKRTGLEYLTGEGVNNYLRDMNIAQIYAQLNRRLIGHAILCNYYGFQYNDIEMIESVHNYINLEDGVLRKGSISAHEGEKVIIPLNMADGVIIGTGKGNADWNNSAPHGAGRTMSRTKAKATLSLEDFQDEMKDKGVWSSTANIQTLDEAPGAYKPAEEIVEHLKDTVDIVTWMKPIYNFKAND